jgi:hypothetical protein
MLLRVRNPSSSSMYPPYRDMTYIMPLIKRERYTSTMKHLLMLLTASLALFLPSYVPAACNVCHSKDPKMVHMHSALGYKDCFICHGPSAKPTDRSKRSDDQRCLPCHKN